MMESASHVKRATIPKMALVLNVSQLHFAYNVGLMENALHANQIHKTSLTRLLANVKFVLILFLIAIHVIMLILVTDANHNHTTLKVLANYVNNLM